MNKMMRGIVVALCAGAALAASGCGSSVCDRYESVNKTMQSKVGDCENVTIKSAPRAVCDANISKCTADDEKKINDQLDCMEQMSTCQKGSEGDWFGEAAACAQKVQGVSEDCAKAFKSE